MVKFKIEQFKFVIILILFLNTISYAQQKESLQVQLWKSILDEDHLENFKSIQDFIDNKGWEAWGEWSDAVNANVIVDDSKNGYLKVNRYYEQNTAGAYKDKNGDYTIITNHVFRHFTRAIFSNRELESIFPKDFGITNFISNTTQVPVTEFSYFYLEAVIPRKGTDTQLNLKLIPFGLFEKGNILTYAFKESANTDNMFLYNFINKLVKKLDDNYTLSHLLDQKFDAIAIKDKEIIDQFIAEDNQFNTIEALSKLLAQFKSVYNLCASITYKSIILGWNGNEGRFFVKDRIKEDAEKLSFKGFLENAAYYMALQ